MKVLVGMSGGIDSSVAAYLLKRGGHHTEGVTMLLWKQGTPYRGTESSSSCYCPDRAEDIAGIKRICEKIGIEHRIIDCSDLFEKEVLRNFRSEYLGGRTPNPCVICNRKVKFGAMVEKAKQYTDFDCFATGHYAKITDNGKRWELRKATDLKKDQSYFLSRLTQSQLSRTLFPLGDYTKKEIRKIDTEMGFHSEGAEESMDFYAGEYSEILGIEPSEGNIIMSDGRILGKHRGFWNYTIGQRKGLGISYKVPLYVIAIDSESNSVIVGTDEEAYGHSLVAHDVNFVSEESFDEDRIYTVKVRSTHSGSSAHVAGDSEEMRVEFIEPVRGISPGQSAVVYDGDRVIASGFIG